MKHRTCPLCGCDGHGQPVIVDTYAYRFWSKVDVRTDDECWEWQGSRSSFGHGRFRMSDDIPGHEGKTRTAHRIAYWLHTGWWPEGLVVRHTCDNPPCVNPRHLLVGTHADNARDRDERGRLPVNHNALKTHCIRNHPFDEANTRYDSWGRRVCRACKNARERARKRAKRARSLQVPAATVNGA